MTVSYTPHVATASRFLVFRKAMTLYAGSIYKLIWRELLCFMSIFIILFFTNYYVLSEPQQLNFKRMRDTFSSYKSKGAMNFAMGLFVALVMDRWWTMHKSIPSPDPLAILVSAAVSGHSERCRLIRRTTVRYVLASYILTFRKISVQIKKRFPNLESLVLSGILLKNEEEHLKKFEGLSLSISYVMPLVWAANILNQARKQGLIISDCLMQDILLEMAKFRRLLGDILSFDMVCIPLAYTQVVTLSVYFYFFNALISNQICYDEELSISGVIISLTLSSLEFVFHVGWFKVAEILINPFGEDDDDFDLSHTVDRNIKAVYLIVDEMKNEEPEIEKDIFFDSIVPDSLPYTIGTLEDRKGEPKGSADDFVVNGSDALFENKIRDEKTKRSVEYSSVSYKNVNYLNECSDSDEETHLQFVTYAQISHRHGSFNEPSTSKDTSHSILEEEHLYSTMGDEKDFGTQTNDEDFTQFHTYENLKEVKKSMIPDSSDFNQQTETFCVKSMMDTNINYSSNSMDVSTSSEVTKNQPDEDKCKKIEFVEDIPPFTI